jgi:hypothetical protein
MRAAQSSNTNRTFRALYALSAMTALAAAPMVACTVQASNGAHAEVLGKVEAALSAVGSDGATYSIPTTAALVVQGPAGVSCSPITSTATETLSFPVGSYAVYLSANGCTSSVPAAGGATDGGGAADAGATDAGASVPFTLDRSGDDGGTSTVSALLVNPVQTVSVAAGGTSSLVFHFTLEQLGTLTMTTGNVNVSLATDASVASSTPTQGTVLTPFTSTSISSADQSLVSLLAVTGASGSVDLSIEELSAFTPNAEGQACATFTPVYSTSINTAAFTDLFEELGAPGAVGVLCFNDATASSDPTGITITVQRTGVPVTAAFESALASDSGASDAEGSAPPQHGFRHRIPGRLREQDPVAVMPRRQEQSRQR